MTKLLVYIYNKDVSAITYEHFLMHNSQCGQAQPPEQTFIFLFLETVLNFIVVYSYGR